VKLLTPPSKKETRDLPPQREPLVVEVAAAPRKAGLLVLKIPVCPGAWLVDSAKRTVRDGWRILFTLAKKKPSGAPLAASLIL
jgi:hypothetical protein